jgi:mannosylglucosylglycerate synthase
MGLFWKKAKEELMKNFTEADVPKLRYGMLHCRFGDPEGVSIVMQQIENVLNKNMEIPLSNIRYLVGTSGKKSWRITENEFISERHTSNELMYKQNYAIGYGGGSSEKIENAIRQAKNAIEEWVSKNKIDVLIAHNSSHPVNFVSSVALSRFYRDRIEQGKKTPKYILWWHDSHLERKDFLNPPRDVENYLLEGVPGKFVDYTIFINSLQFDEAKKYFSKLDLRNPGFLERMSAHHGIVYNTTDTFIENFKELESNKFNERVSIFMKDFKVNELLKEHKLKPEKVLFCLQHTRMVERKRIDFALKYCYELLQRLKEKGLYKGLYFFISGHDAVGMKQKLMDLNKKLQEEYDTDKVFLVFAEDRYEKTSLTFEEYPKIFAKLWGITTYFSDVEGFGNNLLEVLASGLIPVVYKYPVYKKDIEPFGFNLIAFDEFEFDNKKFEETIKLLRSKKLRNEWVDENLEILRKNLSHEIIAVKLKEAIMAERVHI